ncbi:Transposase [Oopsacas minuta]|uniref:Transposase n=1 Tax=Oopsacas minuta TaxID=111878 RepID=A0AAV7KFK0_9METZ|nr:Transposase [Oopsacas minuta]
MLKMPRKKDVYYRAIKRYLETGKVEDRARTGRPCSVVTPKVRKAVREQIRRNPRRSMRKMASVLKISHRSVQRIVKNQLGMRSFKRKTVHFLSSKIMGKRLVRSKGLLKRHAVYGINNILFSDEKLFTIEEANNAQNDRIIATSSQAIPDELYYIGRVQKPQSVMVWAGILVIGRTSLIFVLPGAKINSISYRELILEPVLKDLTVHVSGESFLFQQGGAPAHTPKVTQAWLKENIPDFIPKDEWRPYSPDLNPMDYSIWSILETKACAKAHTNVESLKESLRRE